MKQVVVNIHNALADVGLVYGIDWHQHAMIHDEVQLSCPDGMQETIIKKVLDSFVYAGDFYGFKCKIEGDAKVGYTWYSTH